MMRCSTLEHSLVQRVQGNVDPMVLFGAQVGSMRRSTPIAYSSSQLVQGDEDPMVMFGMQVGVSGVQRGAALYVKAHQQSSAK